jgi:phenylalanyl-tRNA synthetase beta chain
MPKIEVQEQPFFNLFDGKESIESLLPAFPAAKAELDDHDREAGVLKIELNDTNRPDLWSTAGLARQLRVFKGGSVPSYDFFSTKEEQKDYENREIIVDKSVQDVRPYIAGLAVKGRTIDDPLLKEIIQLQEKLCWNFGQKRKAIAMGVHRSRLITYPLQYRGADPDNTAFVPLDFTEQLTLREILEKHPKGRQFGHIVADLERFPFLTDDTGDVLSFPPVINSAKIGAVEIGDEYLFIDLTGPDIYSVTLAASIMACDLSDAGFTILPVKVIYPYDTPFGREIVIPYYFQEPVTVETAYANKLLGIDLSVEEAAQAVRRMGCKVVQGKDTITVAPPVYRNDFLHPVDIIEDIMIGREMESFEPIMPTDFTVGRLTEMTEFSRRVKDIMVGLGFQEMVYNYLGSKRDYIDLMHPESEGQEDGPESPDIIQIDNPMSENFEYVRNSILPSLLSSESVSAHAVYPHRIFEIGKTARLKASENYGTITTDNIGFLNADTGTDFNGVSSQVSALFFYLDREYAVRESDDSRFIPGRTADIIYNGKKAGVFGELSPAVLEKWGIQVPCTGCEIDLSVIVEKEV